MVVSEIAGHPASRDGKAVLSDPAVLDFGSHPRLHPCRFRFLDRLIQWRSGDDERIKALAKRLTGVYDKNIYGPHILWEFPIQLCCRDFVRPGDTVLDVGANIGGLSVAMSRIVGPG